MKKLGMFAVVCAASLFVGCGDKPAPPAPPATPAVTTGEAKSGEAKTEAATTPAEPAKTEEKK